MIHFKTLNFHKKCENITKKTRCNLGYRMGKLSTEYIVEGKHILKDTKL